MPDAKIVYYNAGTDELQINVGEHKLHVGGQPSGYCYGHQSFDCNLTDDEEAAVEEVMATGPYPED